MPTQTEFLEHASLKLCLLAGKRDSNDKILVNLIYATDEYAKKTGDIPNDNYHKMVGNILNYGMDIGANEIQYNFEYYLQKEGATPHVAKEMARNIITMLDQAKTELYGQNRYGQSRF